MDWIERIFGISPDNGSGLTEWLLFLSIAIPVAVVIAVSLLRIWGRNRV